MSDIPEPRGPECPAVEPLGRITNDGKTHVQRFLAAQEGLERDRRTLNAAECEMTNAETELARWLMPKDMKPGEKIGVWVGDSLFQVELVERLSYPEKGNSEPIPSYTPKVTIRTRGKEFWRLR